MFRGRSLVALISAFLLLSSLSSVAVADEHDGGPPHPDPAFLGPVAGAPCAVENEYEAELYGLEVGDVRYGDKCKRIQFAFGPIVVKPGENDALLEPVDIEKPAYDGSIVRFKPDLLEAATGQSPDTDHMHLHHATWLGADYGNGPFFASGEEKTIVPFPDGYGMPIQATDPWLLLYMIHNDHSDSQVVWLTYDIDYVAKDDADEMGLATTKPIWLDVQSGQIHPEAPSSGSNPVFNVQRGFGGTDPETGRKVCVWPKQNCARHDTYGQPSPQQGKTHDDDGKPYDIKGNDWTVTEDLAGTLVAIGGHLHPGGIRDEVSLVRDGVEKPIFSSDAFYWDADDRDNGGRVGSPPTSWDFSMSGTGAPAWKVKIREGDVLRINAVIDAEDASWYENMGIVMAWVAPDDPYGPDGVDVFTDDVALDRGYFSGARIPAGAYDARTGWRPDPCEPDLTGASGQKRLCMRGQPTHGPMEESSNHSGGCPPDGCPPLPDKDGALTTDIVSAAFTYGDADFGVIGDRGIPLLKKGEPAKFWNADAAARIWHTFTRCKEPCTGASDMDYPMPDGGRGDPGDGMDFDSSEIGFGTFLEPASGQLPPSGTGKTWDQTIKDSLFWEFTPTETGTYTFFCRIHKGMRGAFKVIE